MDLLPSIDLRGGRVVRLRRGDDAQRLDYPQSPEALLAGFAAAGVPRAHLVDLDAAFGEPPQRALVAKLLAVRERPALQLGGGLRTRAAIEEVVALGVDRAVVGSLAVREPDLLRELAAAWPGRLVPAIESSGDQLRLSGWRERAERSPAAFAATLRGLPCPAVLVTDVERDGELGGPNLALAVAVARASGLPAILSGGVASLADLARARTEPQIAAAIVGRALLDGRFTLEAALAACRGLEVAS